MSSPVANSDASLDDLRALTLRRLAALAWLADIAGNIVGLLRYWLVAPSLAPRDGSRLRRMVERARHAARVIAALETRLRDSLQMIEAGVRPPFAEALKPLPAAKTADLEAPQRLERPDLHERPERLDTGRFDRLLARPALPRLKGSVDDIVAGVIDDLGAFPAWRRLAEAVWAGQDPTPDEVAHILAGALIEAMPLRRPAPGSQSLSPRSENARHPAPASPPAPPAPA